MCKWSSRVALAVLFLVPVAIAQYQVTNLVSDGSVPANRTDANLVNAWGIVHSPQGPFLVADNGTGLGTAYNANGVPVPKNHPVVVSIPPYGGGNPSGLVYNPTQEFMIGSTVKTAPAEFIFVSEDGTISGWNRQLNPTQALVAHQDSEAIYKGAALVAGCCNEPLLFTTNFHENAVEIYDGTFGEVGSFTDPSTPPRTAPFGIREFNGLLYVTFAVQDANAEDDVPGAGHGAVDVFTTAGTFVKRLITRGALNSPWGLAMAPDDFGEFSGALLVGNFGNGWINAFDPDNGTFLGSLRDSNNNPIVIDGLWGLDFGDGTPAGGPANVLFFTAGPNGENGGLFGRITVVD